MDDWAKALAIDLLNAAAGRADDEKARVMAEILQERVSPLGTYALLAIKMKKGEL